MQDMRDLARFSLFTPSRAFVFAGIPRFLRSLCILLSTERRVGPSKSRRLLVGSLAGALVFGASSCSDQEAHPAAGSPKHIILITLDTTRADRLAPWGGDPGLTPALSELASESIVYLDATTPAPTTLAAHTSIFTGRSPRSHGVPRNGFLVNPENKTLAELLGAAGYHTLAVIGSFALESLFGLDQGFALYDEEFGLEYLPGMYDQNQRRAAEVTDRVLQLLDASLDAESDRSVFLFAHYFDAHAPYDPPAEGLHRVGLQAGERADLKAVGRAVVAQQKAASGMGLGTRWVFSNGLLPELLDGAKGEPLARDLQLEKLYRAEIAYMDAELGRLLRGLRERGVLDECLLILTSDHGETFWEHGDFWNHGLATYQTTMRVPLLVRLPGGQAGGMVVEEPVTTLDLVPTLCALAGLEAPTDLEGLDLSPTFEGLNLPGRVIISEATQPVGEVERDALWLNQAKAKSVRQGRWKYIYTPYLAGREELYDLSVDPAEQQNLLLEPTVELLELASSLRGELEAWAAAHKPLPSSFEDAQMDAVRSRLEALGYSGEDD